MPIVNRMLLNKVNKLARAIFQRVDGGKVGQAVLIGHLIAPQEFLAGRLHAQLGRIGVDALRVAVPDIQLHSGQRQAGSLGDPADPEGKVKRGRRGG